MTASMRYATLNNTSGAPLTEAMALALQTDEKECAYLTIKRTFSAADIGTAAGQSRDTTNPTGGCLIARPVTGAKIKFVETSEILRSTAATNANYDRIIFAADIRISADGLKAYVFDSGAGATQLAAGDTLIVTFVLSNN